MNHCYSTSTPSMLNYQEAAKLYDLGAKLEYMNHPMCKGLPLVWTAVKSGHEFGRHYVYKRAENEQQ